MCTSRVQIPKEHVSVSWSFDCFVGKMGLAKEILIGSRSSLGVWAVQTVCVWVSTWVPHRWAFPFFVVTCQANLLSNTRANIHHVRDIFSKLAHSQTNLTKSYYNLHWLPPPPCWCSQPPLCDRQTPVLRTSERGKSERKRVIQAFVFCILYLFNDAIYVRL